MAGQARAHDLRLGGRRVAALLAEAAAVQPACGIGERAAAVPQDLLLRTARAHRVGPLLDAATPGADFAVKRALAADRRGAAVHQLAVLADLRWLTGALEPAGIPWLVVKGPALAHTVYAEPSLRPYRDLDLLVPLDHFSRAVDRLERAGCRLLDANWDELRRTRAGELHLQLPGGTLLDLHWQLLFHASVRARFGIDTPALFERSRAVRLTGSAVQSTDLADTLVHLALHAAAGGAQTLLLLADVDRVARAGPDWDALVSRSLGWRVAPVVATVLGRARRTFATPVPPEVLRAMLPSAAWRGVLHAVDVLSPAGQPPPAGGLGRLVARAAGGDLRSSARRTGRQLVRHAVPGRAQGPRTTLRAHTGGPDGRDQYLAALRGHYADSSEAPA